ncbi:type 1 glutamine amidotransferase domain-containing protein [Massilia sp. LXY-6]|uniref:type 1 glutamine amidotransferase domain-containing protein n=1 Tax=Massilia sp. LXY-6 TaxID=3379823 RepID=UPI003EE19547
MSASGKLAGKRIAVLAADGVEQAELDAALAGLKDAGAQAALVALRAGRIRSMQGHQPADLVRVDRTVVNVRAADYDALLIPGGYISPDLLRQSAQAREFVRGFNDAGKPIAAMSHAALVLVSTGLAAGRRLTSWPGVRDDLVNAGAIWCNQEVVRDGRMLTSRTPQDAAAFLRALLPLLAGDAEAAPAMLQANSDPPQQAPSELPDQSLRWLAAPSLGAMLSLAIVGVGVVAANRSLRKRESRDAQSGQVQAGPDA